MVIVICGPPCAGKATLARRLAKPDEVVLDIEDVCVELGSSHRWAHSKQVREQAEVVMRQRIRRLAFDCAADGYVIRTAPHPGQRRRLAEQLAATVWVLDPGYQACLARARADGRPRGTEQAIRAWYSRYVSAEVDVPCPWIDQQLVSHTVTSRRW